VTADVFISYRGADRALARKLEQRLRSRWGSRVFRDESGLVGGASWSEGLRTALQVADVVIALVGPGWSVKADMTEEDWVRTELMDAIDRGTPVLPVLVGDPDALRGKLGSLPAAFQLQAVVVEEDIPLSDVVEIVRRLRQLGAFEGAEPNGLAAGRADLVSERAEELVMASLDEGRSVLIEGGTGSGRTALLRRVVRRRTIPGRFVGVCGVQPGDVARSTHAVMGAWFASLCRAIIQEPSTRDRQRLGQYLVDAVLTNGPDLLSRKVIPVGLLLPLGDDRHDQEVLTAARRPTDRWAPYPLWRLVVQARSVLERFVEDAEVKLDLVVNDLDATDASSRDLVADLLRTRAPIQLVLAAAPSPEPPDEALGRMLPTIRRAPPRRKLERVLIDDAAMWGPTGSPLPQWLAGHQIRLDPDLLDQLREPNPYYALAQLWYLTDRGFVTEEEGHPDRAAGEGGETIWKLAVSSLDVPRPSREALLDHMLDEYIPLNLRSLLEIGALVGRTFPYDVVAAAWLTESGDQPQSSEPSDVSRADEVWARLGRADPDNMVLTCHEHRYGERFITFALEDLVEHVAGQIDPQRRRAYHRALAVTFAATSPDDNSEDPDGSFRSVAAAAEHWETAGELRESADAHRHAAEMAERALAYREAERHYRVAIRLLSQLIAETTDSTHDHEDLLIVANCLYRLGQMVRLSGEFSDDDAGSPEDYFRYALERLADLRLRLLEQDFATTPALMTTPFARDIPGPDKVRHLLRLCDALSGYVTLDRATWLEWNGDRLPARLALFETLRYAEAAAGEANSRWLLASASARLAESLGDEAIELVTRRDADAEQAQALAVEALFHVERVVGLRAMNPEEEIDLTEPKSSARAVFGHLLTELHCEPRLAEWVYRKLNRHRDDVRMAVDMATDFRLGQFLLSLVSIENEDAPGSDARLWRSTSPLKEARKLLEGYARWARESAVRRALGPALTRLALAEISLSGGKATPTARYHLERALDDASSDAHEECLLILGFLEALPEDEDATDVRSISFIDDGFDDDDGPRPAPAPTTTLEAFRQAQLIDDECPRDDETVLRDGWRKVALLLLRVCPALGLLAVECAHGYLPDAEADPDLEWARQRAERYLRRVVEEPPMSPVHDRSIEKLTRARLSQRAFAKKERTLEIADQLLDIHSKDCSAGETADLDVLRRDLRWAILVHDWYGEVEPARLLVLASEWHEAVNGSQWAAPRLLRGPLAIALLRDQFDAETELGTERFNRIARLVEHDGTVLRQASALEMVCYLARHLAGEQAQPSADSIADAPSRTEEPGSSSWQSDAYIAGCLSQAYRRALIERAADPRSQGPRRILLRAGGETAASPRSAQLDR
jgi:hypothetical protein